MADTIATVRTKKDGVMYEIGDTIPDMGSIVCTSREGDLKSFAGLSKDASKLPTTHVATDSTAVFNDTAEIQKFDGESGTWKPFGGQ